MLQILRNYSLAFVLFFLPINTHSYEFDVKEVENNIFVHFGVHEDANKLNSGDICNIGFIIGKKSVLVVDPGGTPKIAEKLIEQIKKKTILPISHVVITHGVSRRKCEDRTSCGGRGSCRCRSTRARRLQQPLPVGCRGEL